MVVKGIGIDIVEIARVREAVERYGDKFLQRIFTSEELTYSKQKVNPYPHLAVRFAAKEAAAKALGDGIAALGWKNIEVESGDGPPRLRLKGKAQGVARAREISDSFISLSHCRDYAVAQIIFTGVMEVEKK